MVTLGSTHLASYALERKHFEINGSLVVVWWSECSPSTQMMRVQIAQKSAVFILSNVAWKECKLGQEPSSSGGDSCPRGCAFESQCCILDGSFFKVICCVKLCCGFKRPKINKKGAGNGPFLKNVILEKLSLKCPVLGLEPTYS